jgi:hypothetical protein
LSLVWGLLACVSICAAHLSETAENEAAPAALAFDDCHESDCCQLKASSVDLPVRRTFAPDNGPAGAPVGALEYSRQFRLYPQQKPSPSPSPPLKLTCNLRI